MGVTKRKDTGRFRARYRGPNGKEYSQDFDRKKDADRWLNGQIAAVNRGDWVDPALGKATVGEWAPKWLATKRAKKIRTYNAYDSQWRVHIKPRWEDVPLAKITHEDIAEWVAGLVAKGLSASSVHRAYQALHNMIEFAVRSGRLSTNRASGVELPTAIAKEQIFLTAGQVEALAGASGEWWAPLIYFLAYTGCRWGEAAGLTWSRVDLLRARVYIAVIFGDDNGKLYEDTPKAHQRRWIGIPRFLVDTLTTRSAGKHPTDLVFTTETGAALRLSNFRHRVFDSACEKAGIVGLNPHGLRHTAASLAISSGASIKAVQRMLGHKTATMTLDLYGHLYPDEMDALASALDKVAEEARSKTADVRQLKETN